MPKSLITYFKKFLKILVIHLFLFLQINIIHANDVPEKFIGVANVNCPYVCENKSVNSGFLIEIVRRSLAYSGVKFDYKILSQKKFDDSIKNTSADIFIGTTKNENGADFLLFNSNPVIKASFSLYEINKYSSNQKYNGTDETFFKDKILGAQSKNKFLITEIKKYIINNMLRNPEYFVFFDSENIIKSEINALLNNKIDVLLENDDVINYYFSLEPNLKDKIVKIKSFDQKVDFYISFPNTEEGKKYLSLFESGFKKLSSNDGYEILELRKKYGLNK
jgi:ABC-type amino acid transport substrate-binding protein